MTNDSAHILVTYASEFGSTAGVANAIADQLRERGATVDVQPVVNISTLRPYSAVIIGSAIYNGAWLPEAVHFVRFFAAELCRKPVAYFAVSMTMRQDTPENRRFARSFLDPVIQDVPDVVPIDIGLFAGSVNVHKLPWTLRIWIRLTTQLRHGDLRNWQAIRRWADQIYPHLIANPATMSSNPNQYNSRTDQIQQ